MIGSISQNRTPYQSSLASEPAAANNRTFTVLSVIFVVSAVFFIAVYVNVPLSLSPSLGHDDGLYIQHGYSIAVGDWLGPYSQMTHMKGAGYPLFLAAMSLFRIPIPLAQAVFYAAAIGLLGLVTFVLSRSSLLAVLVFELALWNFGPESDRISRDAIYASQFIVAFCLLLLSVKASGWQRFTLVGISGIFVGWLWSTREEGIIAVPAILLILCLATKDYFTGRQYKAAVSMLIIFATCSVLVPFAIAYQNFRSYGVFITTDINGRFQSAVSSLETIKANKNLPYLAVPSDVRLKAYSVSLTFARLRPWLDLEGSPLLVWKQFGCEIARWTCGDYATGWFVWAFRDAAAQAGAYADATTAANFFSRIHDEVANACKLNKVACQQSLIPFIPPITRDEVIAFPKSFWLAARKLIFLDAPLVQYGGSFGTEERIREAATFVNVYNYAPLYNPKFVNEWLTRGVDLPVTARSSQTMVAVTVKKWLIHQYSRFLPWLVGFGLLNFFINCYFALVKRVYPLFFIVTALAWFTVFLRLALLALVDVTAFGAIYHFYISLAFPLTCFASVASIYILRRRLMLENPV